MSRALWHNATGAEVVVMGALFFGILGVCASKCAYCQSCFALEMEPVPLPVMHVVTPCERPQHLHLLLPHLCRARRWWNLTWWVVYPTPPQCNLPAMGYPFVRQLVMNG
eukprot:RCo016803